MMFIAQGPLANHCTLLAVISSAHHSLPNTLPKYPFPPIVSSSRLEVQVITNPSVSEFNRAILTFDPSIVYLQGQRLENSEEFGSIMFDKVELSSPDSLCKAFGSSLPATVYLEVPNGEKLAQALHSKGVPFVIYWRGGSFSCFAAAHFRNALFQVIQSSCCHSCDAFQLAHASFRLYCVRNNKVAPSTAQKAAVGAEPCLLGEPPKIDISSAEADDQEEDDNGDLPAIKIYDEHVTIRFLVCGESSLLNATLLRALEDGLNSLLNIEIRGSKLHNRSSAPPPPLQAAAFTRGVVTMRCDLSTCSGANVSLLVSGSADTCFKDHLLENHIRNEIILKNQAVRAVSDANEYETCEPGRSLAIGCGASVFEVRLKVPTWGYQIMRQLSPDVSYRTLVMLGIASVQGLPVASFEKDDADRFLFFCCNDEKNGYDFGSVTKPPSWFIAPPPNALGNLRRKVNIAALRPIPHTQSHKIVPLSVAPASEKTDLDHAKGGSAPASASAKQGSVPAAQRKSVSSSHPSQQAISLNPLPLKKHGCGRSPIQACNEEEFLKDVMQFLLLRGHNRLVPHGGLAEFPDAILNAKRLDLFNLYREVVSRGGFHVGNGINWKGQVFSKMRNHTLTNRMTGVGNTLKRHYETYLLEYELAHDDVDGESCLMCHSSAAGDWVNCGICGEWAHFGCDRRQGLGAFKDYAKTDGLEYICPHCSNANMKKKLQKTANGF